MTTPTALRQKVDLSSMAALDRAYRTALEEKKAHDAYIEDLKARIQAKMGDGEVAVIEGVERYTWAKSDAFAYGEFAKAHPDIAETYKIKVTKEVYDVAAIARDHPTLIEPFRTRPFLVK